MIIFSFRKKKLLLNSYIRTVKWNTTIDTLHYTTPVQSCSSLIFSLHLASSCRRDHVAGSEPLSSPPAGKDKGLPPVTDYLHHEPDNDN